MRYIYSYIVNIQRIDEETMSERYERLVEEINMIAVGCTSCIARGRGRHLK